MPEVGSDAFCFITLSPKNERKAEASSDDDETVGRVGRGARLSKEFSVVQRLRGFVACFEMSVR